ncbi:MAG: VWA domain-containing protein [Cytophagales bacterium]|nr:MAG: VWA domain-containing protein [Cytophagales bacterium]
MEQLKIISEHSWGWLFLAILIALGYSFLLYTNKSPWSRNWNYALALGRFLWVLVLLVLLFINPLIRLISNTLEKPIVVIALDNSLSVKATTSAATLQEVQKKLDTLISQLQSEGVEVEIDFFDKNTQKFQNFQKVSFQHPSTPIYELLQNIKNNYENRNIDKVILLTDGIYNQGASPLFANFNFPIITIGLGDPTPKNDIRIQTVLANKVAYLGNKFPITADIESNGFAGKSTMVYLSQNGKVIDKKMITFGAKDDLQTVSFYAQAEQKGIQRLTISVEAIQGEFSTENNTRDVYVEVIDGREKILIIATAPHPDIKALKSTLNKNENYQVTTAIVGLQPIKEEKYDLVFFYQIPNLNQQGNEWLQKFKQSNTPVIFVLGAQSDIANFNQQNNALRINVRMGQVDKVTPVFNKNFTRLNLDPEKANLFNKFPPLTVPFGEYSIPNGADVILTQKVGNVETAKALIVMNTTGNRNMAVIAGEGIWQWRIEEYNLTEKHEVFDDFLNRLVQYMTTKEDRRKLRVYPINEEFYDFEKVVFETEVYNDLYERVYDQKINLTITHESGKTYTYNIAPTASNSRFERSGLPKGVYRYQASMAQKNNVESVTGQFTVKEIQLESINYTADHAMLKELAKRTQGKFFMPEEWQKMNEYVKKTQKPDLIHTTESLNEAIHLKWVFFLVLILFTIEWVIRKYQGSY